MRKVALITGIVGQDGYYLTDLLLNKNYEVHGMVQSMNQYNSSKITEYEKNENFFIHIGDMTDTSNLNGLLEKIKPDVYTKGADYNIETLPERDIVLRNNIKVEFIEFVEGKSTTKVIEKINS